MWDRNSLRNIHIRTAYVSGFVLLLIMNFFAAGKGVCQEAKNALKAINLTQKGIPADERAIHSLISKGSVIYGATSGRRAHVFKLDAGSGNLVDLAKIEGPATIHQSLTMDANGSLWFGTMLDKVQTYMAGRKKGKKLHLTEVSMLPITPDLHVGHLYRVMRPESVKPIVEDMGVPVSGQAIYSMVCDPMRNVIYGFTYPLGRFFIYDIQTGNTETITYGKETMEDYPKPMEAIIDVTIFIPYMADILGKNIARALILDKSGNLYTSGHKGKLLFLPRGSKRFEEAASLPCSPGREEWASIDALTWGPDGNLYGATIDGYIFRFSPGSKKLTNFGKPFRSQGISGLVCRSDGMLYGVGGGTLEGLARFFAYNTIEGGFELATYLQEEESKKSSAEWKTTYNPLGLVSFHGVGAMAVDNEDRIIIGETMRKANIIIVSPVK